MVKLLTDTQVIERVFDHIKNGTTDEGEDSWQEPTENYTSQARFDAEMTLLRKIPIPYCPTVAVPEPGSYVARTAAGIPLLVARGNDGVLRGFRNACRHRGMAVAQGTGCTKAFVCPYHAWAYRLDGKLQYITHESGFPDLDKDEHGLVPITVKEKGGIIFVLIDDQVDEGPLDELPVLLQPNQEIFSSSDVTSKLNWKLNMESNMEGYHIKPAHKETFYPYGYDNLNVVETFGRNCRITFPFRRIEKLKDKPKSEWDINGLVTYVYNIFPIATLAVLSNHTALTISEPISPTKTRYFTYRLSQDSNVEASEKESATLLKKAEKDVDFLANTGAREDVDLVKGIQANISSGANSHFIFGKYEKMIVNFHKHLHEVLAL